MWGQGRRRICGRWWRGPDLPRNLLRDPQSVYFLLPDSATLEGNSGMDSRALLRLLESGGWKVVGQKGSHVQLKSPDRPGRVTVPHPKKDLPIGTVRSIERQSGLKLTRR